MYLSLPGVMYYILLYGDTFLCHQLSKLYLQSRSFFFFSPAFMPNFWIHIFIYPEYNTSTSTYIFASKPNPLLFLIIGEEYLSLYMQKPKLKPRTNPDLLSLNMEFNHLLQGGGEELQRPFSSAPVACCHLGIGSQIFALVIWLFLGSKNLRRLPPPLKI